MSSNYLDMVRLMIRCGAMRHRLSAFIFPPEEMIEMRRSRRDPVGMDHELGSIEVGKKPDIACSTTGRLAAMLNPRRISCIAPAAVPIRDRQRQGA